MMSGHRLILALVFLLGSVNYGYSADEGRSIGSDVTAAVAKLLAKIANSPLVNPAYNIDNVLIDINTGGTKLNGSINGTVTGIPETKLTENKFAVIGMKHTVGLSMPKLTAKGNYSIQGVLAGILLLDGGGPFVIELGDLSATIVVYVKSKETRFPALTLRNVTAKLSLGTFHVKIDNILGELSDALNDMINEIAPEVLTVYQPQIETLVAKLLFNVINGLLPETPSLDFTDVSAAVGEIINQAIAVAVENLNPEIFLWSHGPDNR